MIDQIKKPDTDKNRCFYCDVVIAHSSAIKKGVSGLSRTREHIIPKSKGGHGMPENIIYACQKCNSKRSNQDLEDFLLTVKNPFTRSQVEKLIKYVKSTKGTLTKEGIKKHIIKSGEQLEHVSGTKIILSAPVVLGKIDLDKAPKKKAKVIFSDKLPEKSKAKARRRNAEIDAAKIIPLPTTKEMHGRVSKKYPHAYSLIDTNMWTWIFDNVLNMAK